MVLKLENFNVFLVNIPNIVLVEPKKKIQLLLTRKNSIVKLHTPKMSFGGVIN